ncbi:MAG: hypothetical protein KF754_09155 [Planctomycetes bacterium]|nr:hypothetical protein [Planctomycetota bacterium]
MSSRVQSRARFAAHDMIFVRGLAVQQIGALADHFDGRLPSDHFPVLAEVLLE